LYSAATQTYTGITLHT